jgi:hypothetical protein
MTFNLEVINMEWYIKINEKRTPLTGLFAIVSIVEGKVFPVHFICILSIPLCFTMLVGDTIKHNTSIVYKTH